MARFNYLAQDSNGASISGTLQANHRNAALQSLASRYPLVTQLREIKPQATFFVTKLSKDDILALLQQLSVAISAGVPLKNCLDNMARDAENPLMQKMLTEVAESLTAGTSLSEAMTMHPGVFEPIQCKLVKAGEASGNLPEVLKRIADDMEGREGLIAQVKSAIAYPSFVVVVAVIMSSFLLAWGVPQVKKVYDSMGAQLPLPTRILVVIGQSFNQYGLVWIFLMLAAGYGARKALQMPPVRRVAEDLALHLKLVGPLYRLLNVAAFARILGLLYRSGLPLSSALEMLQDATASARMKKVVGTIRTRVTQGELLSLAMRSTGFFPSLAIEMVTTGENAGCLDRMLEELNRFYTRRCEVQIKALTSMIEPFLTVLVGILLGGIILGLAVPFLNLPALMM
jgi:type IV pilus assembly protein PilC